MRLITFSIKTPLGEITRVGALHGEQAVDLAAAYESQLHELGVYDAQPLATATIPADMVEFLSRSPVALDAAKAALASALEQPTNALSPSGARIRYDAGDYRIRIPLRPRRLKDYLVYEEHKKKSMARKGLEMPELWYKMPTYTNRNVYGIADPGEDVHWPAYSKKLDFEFELAVVIGRKGRNIRVADALNYVAGITIYNDFSARDVQADEGRIGAGAGKSKDFDQGNVLGPCIVTLDEIDPADIGMVLRVDGEEWARGHTNGMKFSWGQIIENASKSETIFPGDVFASGTMDRGCGLELDRWIKPGSTVELEAEGIGLLRNKIVEPE